jgi:hypothetical protein
MPGICIPSQNCGDGFGDGGFSLYFLRLSENENRLRCPGTPGHTKKYRRTRRAAQGWGNSPPKSKERDTRQRERKRRGNPASGRLLANNQTVMGYFKLIEINVLRCKIYKKPIAFWLTITTTSIRI